MVVNLKSSSDPWGSINLRAKGNPGESNFQVTLPLKIGGGHYSLRPRAPPCHREVSVSRFGVGCP
jgi:hypothetical protein